MEINLHGMNVYQARIAVRSAFNRVTSADYRLRVVHGFHGGTAIKNMILDEFSNHPLVIRVEPSFNPGETIFVLREYI
ncbi:MAG: Smr/MutS family protein [Christensenellales bacterium]|mgnify:FL=1|jgi:DNA-nicking Smr family endonuclease|nr:Smr/MutS family protein [Christensenellaceae bacterium]